MEGPAGLTIEQSLRFDFKTTNNQAEYEAIIAGLSLAKEMGAKEIQCRSDSKLTAGHLTGEFQVKDHMMMQYYQKVLNLLSTFKEAKVEHIRREQNARVDLLAKLASTKNKNHHHSVIQMTVPAPSIPSGEEVMNVEEDEDCWMTPIVKFLKEDTCEEAEEIAMRRKCARYILIREELYRRGYSRPLLKCVIKSQA